MDDLIQLTFSLLSQDNGLPSQVYYKLLDYVSLQDPGLTQVIEKYTEATDDTFYFPKDVYITDIEMSYSNIQGDSC
jgi:hypothetical protein